MAGSLGDISLRRSFGMCAWGRWPSLQVEEIPGCVSYCTGSYCTGVAIAPVLRAHPFPSQLRPSHVLISLAQTHTLTFSCRHTMLPTLPTSLAPHLSLRSLLITLPIESHSYLPVGVRIPSTSFPEALCHNIWCNAHCWPLLKILQHLSLCRGRTIPVMTVITRPRRAADTR